MRRQEGFTLTPESSVVARVQCQSKFFRQDSQMSAKPKQVKGFTLIELLVVIAIIGILSSLAVVSLGDARLKAYDAQIKNDIAQFRTSINLNTSKDETVDYEDWVMPTYFTPPACSYDGQGANPGYKKSLGKDYFVIWAELCQEVGAFCVDATGFAGVVDHRPKDNAVSCFDEVTVEIPD